MTTRPRLVALAVTALVLLLALLGLASLVAIAVAGLRSATSRRQPMPRPTFPVWCEHGRGAGQWCRWCQPTPNDAISGAYQPDEPGGGW